MSSTKFTVRITPAITASELNQYTLDYDGVILNAGSCRDWISAAYLLKGCEPSAEPGVANFEVWRRWSRQNPNVSDDEAQLQVVWSAINPYSGIKKAIDDVTQHLFYYQQQKDGKIDPPVERHPVQLVVKVAFDKANPKPITLFVEDSRQQPTLITELDPNKQADMVKAVYCLKSKDICPKAFQVQADGFKLLERWHGQAEVQMPDLDLLTMWQSVLPAERFEEKPQVSDVPDPIQSARSRIGALLDEHTNLADTLTDSWADQGRVAIEPDAIIVDNLPKLQQRLADLFAELHKHHTADQLVLKARGATVQDCHTLGLLSDDDMANHLADCLMVVLGKPVSARAAKAIMLTAMEYAEGADWSTGVGAAPIPVGMLPSRGTVWRHHGGNLYEVVGYANVDSTNPKYPVTIIYQGKDNRKTWSRPAHLWDRSFTLATDQEQLP